MVKNRRIFQRLDGIVNVRYAVSGRDEQKIETLPRNIGGGGIGVCLTERLQSGTIVELEIIIPDNPQKAVLGRGEVLWTKPFGILTVRQDVRLYETGIRFIDINPISIGRVYSYYRQIK
jgi:c-di-GMP-binding flagellar brake protein YcgR